MKTLQGKLTIAQWRGGSGGVHVEVHDTDSGCIACRVEVDLETFAQALFGLAHVPCTFDFNDSGNVGMKCERKEELVFVPDGPWGERAKRAGVAVKALEVDGWQGRVGDATNGHNRRGNRDGGDLYAVHFSRWVPKEA